MSEIKIHFPTDGDFPETSGEMRAERHCVLAYTKSLGWTQAIRRRVGKKKFEWVCSDYDGNTLFFDEEITAADNGNPQRGMGNRTLCEILPRKGARLPGLVQVFHAHQRLALAFCRLERASQENRHERATDEAREKADWREARIQKPLQGASRAFAGGGEQA